MMELNEKDIKKILVFILILILGILVFFLLKPIILSIIWGLILSYAFFPLYKKVLRVVKKPNLAASLISLLILFLIVIPIYFLVPPITRQFVGFLEYARGIDMKNLIVTAFPSLPQQIIIEATNTLDNSVNNMGKYILGWLTNFLLDFPTLLLNLAIVAFVFFFSLRDSEKLKEFTSSLSPINKVQEKELIKQFKDITNSVLYGQILIGLTQGLAAGIGFLLFGIPHPLVLMLLAILFSIIPILGAFFIWIPATIYLYIQGNIPLAIIYLIYNLTIVSNTDNLLRIYLVSKKTKLSQVIVLIGMVGGLFIFGILGLILGPLLLAYFITILHAYRSNTLFSFFKSEKKENV